MDDRKNINKRLEDLITTFEIDRYHPRFRQKLRAEKLIADFTKEHTAKGWILISRDKTDRDFFCSSAGELQDEKAFLYEELDDATMGRLSEMEKDHEVILVSCYRREEVMNQLYNHGLHPVSLYDYFEARDFHCLGNYYDVFGKEYRAFHGGTPTFDYGEVDLSGIFFYDRRGYENAVSKEMKELYLAKMIFDCAFAKDFERMEAYIHVYVEARYRDYEQYEQFQEEVNDLLQEIKQMLAQRDKRDIVVFWLDQLEYGEDTDMPFLSSLRDKSLDFDSAFTTTPYTHSAAKALFHGKYVVDDRAYKLGIDSSSKLAVMLKERGYKVSFYTYLNQVKNDIKGLLTQNIYTPLSELGWNLLYDLLNNDRPVFVILHEIIQTHVPYASMGVIGNEYTSRGWHLNFPITAREKDLREEQKIKSKVATDNVLKFYSDMLNPLIFKIYMSDHGHTYLDKFHTIFRVIQRDIKPKQIYGIFSYIRFNQLIEKLIDGNEDYSEVCSDYAKIQDVDYYFGPLIQYVLCQEQTNLMGICGYEGIVAETEYYLRYNDGREEFYSRRPGQKLSEERFNHLRDLCPVYPKDILRDEKFRYSRCVYATRERYLKRNGAFEEEKLRQIAKIFEQIPADQVIALRGGGIHTYRLWQALPWRIKKRIAYVIDRDDNCMAARVGLEMIRLKQLAEKQVDYVVISSFDYEKEWLRELEQEGGEYTVVGLYQELEKNGICCKKGFYNFEYTKEDVVWEE